MPESLIKFLKNRFQLSLFLLIVVYLVGIVTVLLGHADDLMVLTPFNLIFAAAVLIYNAEGISRSWAIWFTIVALAGYWVEVLGIKTGLVFGEYEYGSNLGLKVLGVPLIIGLNWAVLVIATAALVHRLNLNNLIKSALAASLMVAYDIFLEPVAITFDFWTWAGGSIPLQNYIAWWIIAFFMLLGAFTWVKNLKNRLALYVIAIQTLFFLILIIDQNLKVF
jgi:bisanhydrobacterioruberin hydratase